MTSRTKRRSSNVIPFPRGRRVQPDQQQPLTTWSAVSTHLQAAMRLLEKLPDDSKARSLALPLGDLATWAQHVAAGRITWGDS
jgi:hypothetical protein